MDDSRPMIDLQNDASRRWITAGLTGAALLSAAYWTEAIWLRARQGTPQALTQTAGLKSLDAAAAQGAAVAAPEAEALARLLGAQPTLSAAPATPADRFKVMGVIASASGRGAALIAVDGQAPRAYRVGSELAPGFVLHSVAPSALNLSASPGGNVLVTLPVPKPGSIGSAGSATAPGGAIANPDPLKERVGGGPAAGGSRSNPRGAEASPQVASPATSPPATPSATPP